MVVKTMRMNQVMNPVMMSKHDGLFVQRHSRSAEQHSVRQEYVLE